MKTIKFVGSALLAVTGTAVFLAGGAIGFALCLTIIGIPIGVFMILGAWFVGGLCCVPLMKLFGINFWPKLPTLPRQS